MGDGGGVVGVERMVVKRAGDGGEAVGVERMVVTRVDRGCI